MDAAGGDGRRAWRRYGAAAAPDVAVTERGTFFGYGDLVVDMRSFARLRAAAGAPVIFDATHAVQQPGQGTGGASGGEREFIPRLDRRRGGRRGRRVFSRDASRPRQRAERRRDPWPLDRLDALVGRDAGVWDRRRDDRSRSAARRVRLVGLDVDGVLTDGGIYLGRSTASVVELKRYDIQDGLGHVLLREAGVSVVWVSGRFSEATSARARELKVEEVLQVPGPRKLEAFGALLERRGIAWEDAAFVGDDLADLQVLRRVGLPIAVANAVAEVKDAAGYVTRATGGHGAVREVVEVLLKARGQWAELLERYFMEPAPSAV